MKKFSQNLFDLQALVPQYKGVFSIGDLKNLFLTASVEQANQKLKPFLDLLQTKRIRGFTSIFNVLEVCGVMSFNASNEELFRIYSGFTQFFAVKLILPTDAQGKHLYDFSKIFSFIQGKQSLGDAQISYVAEKFSDKLDAFVTWNKAHFEGKIPMKVVTPEEMLGISSTV